MIVVMMTLTCKLLSSSLLRPRETRITDQAAQVLLKELIQGVAKEVKEKKGGSSSSSSSSSSASITLTPEDM